jgi:hypothetical protein
MEDNRAGEEEVALTQVIRKGLSDSVMFRQKPDKKNTSHG